MRISTLIVLFTSVILLTYCKNEQSDRRTSANNTQGTSSPDAIELNEVNFPSFELIGEIDQIFNRPESIVFDSTSKMLYVSNVGNDEGTEADGYISKLNLHGQVIDSNWLEGLTNPRGMCILGEMLLVADENRILRIDIKSGKVIDKITSPDLKQLSDLEKDAEGTVYVTDTKLNSIYTLNNDRLQLWKNDTALDGPAGLYHSGDQIWVTSAGGNKLMAVDIKSGKTRQIADSLQNARGITMIDQDLIVGGLSGLLYGVKASTDFRWPLIDLQMQKDNFADILYIKEYDVLFVPTYKGNSVLAISVLN